MSPSNPSPFIGDDPFQSDMAILATTDVQTDTLSWQPLGGALLGPSSTAAYTNTTALQEHAVSAIANLPPLVSGGMAVMFLTYLLLGVTGNLLTAVALVRCRRLANVTSAFIVSLCVCDLLFCVLVLPWEVSRFLLRRWVWGEGVVCTILPLLRYWNVAASLLSIAMITINRYISIAHYAVYGAIYRPVCVGLMIAFCWLFPLAMLFPTLLGVWGRFGLDHRLDTCSIIATAGERPKEALFGLGFCVPALVIVVCYSLIFRAVRRSERRVRTHRVSPTTETSVAKSDGEIRRKRNEWRITKMVLIIFVTFLLTYLPITLVKTFDRNLEYPGLHMLGYVLIYVSCCVNPVIYVIMNRQYRQAYRTVLLCRTGRLSSFTLTQTGGPRAPCPSSHSAPQWEKRHQPPEQLDKTIVLCVSSEELANDGKEQASTTAVVPQSFKRLPDDAET